MTNVWKYCNFKGQEVKEISDYQVDQAGNVLQRNGAVNPKACQDCGRVFKSIINKTPVTQQVPFFTCKDCEFSNPGAPAALDHKIMTNHNITKTIKERIVKYENTSSGALPVINRTEDECLIQCAVCANK